MQTNPFAIKTRYVLAGDKKIATDQEGYIQNMDDWSEEFARALANKEDLELTAEHWDVINFIRNYYEEHAVQAQVRDMIKHFKKHWGTETGNNHYLHKIFPKGGPQKQGNRLAAGWHPPG